MATADPSYEHHDASASQDDASGAGAVPTRLPPTIAIIGRPNVGKSTLFNRLVGRREALVSDMPGLTRDRRMGETSLNDTTLRLIDTAGLEEASDGSIPARMREQSERAIAEADVVCFVIDARAGVVPADQAFATIARQAGRPVVLVANKCESHASDAGYYDAYALGFGEPVAISAEHGQGLADLWSAIETAFREAGQPFDAWNDDRASADESDQAKPLRLAIVGRPNAGKSTLVNALLGDDRMITGPEPGLTRDTIATDLSWRGRPVKLFDTAGLRRKARVTERAEKLSAGDALRAIDFAEVVVLLMDATRAMEHQDLAIADQVTREGRALVVAVNKWDLVEDKQAMLKDLREDLADSLAQVQGVPIVALSALSGRGIDKVMQSAFQTYEIWNMRVSTPDLNRWLDEAVQRHPPPAVSGRRLKIRYLTQPHARPPTFVAFCSRPDDLPKSYVRYLVNGLRDTFGFKGVPLRFQLRRGKNPYAGKS